MKLITFLLLSLLSIARTRPPSEGTSRQSRTPFLHLGFKDDKPGDSRLHFPNTLVTLPLPNKSPDRNAVEELFAAEPEVPDNPDILLDPDLPYPDINHHLPEEATPNPAHSKDPGDYHMLGAAAPTPAGTYLGTVGKETPHFVRKCTRCCRVTKAVFDNQMGPLSPARGCSSCTRSYIEPKRGKCPEGRYLGHFYTPTNCFFERCHRMLLKGSGCMCFWDRWSQARGSSQLAIL